MDGWYQGWDHFGCEYGIGGGPDMIYQLSFCSPWLGTVRYGSTNLQFLKHFYGVIGFVLSFVYSGEFIWQFT